MEHFDNFDATNAVNRFFEHGDGAGSSVPGKLNDGWYESSVPVSLACDKTLHKSEDAAPILNIAGLYHRKPLDVIKATLQESNAQRFHLAPFEEYWVPQPDGPLE